MNCKSGVRPQASGFRVRMLPLCAVGFVIAFVACARVQPPPGGARDETPPAVISITPEPMSTVAPSDEPVVIAFEERISERDVEDAIYVSPATGALDVSQGRRDIEVRIAGGWQPGRVYRVVVQPKIRDLFENTIPRPIEIAFSTGGEFSQAALAGVAYERVTGNAVADVRVEARPVEGGAYHLALTDSGGVYRLPYLPPGTYLLRGYADQNRDRRRDAYETADSTTVVLGATDTVLRPLALLRPDSTAANLTRVQVVDSITLRLQFDDYMDVGTPQQLANVIVRTLPDSTIVPLAGVYYPHVLAEERERQDSIARDSAAVEMAAADSAAAPTPPADTVRPADDRRTTARRDSAAVDTIPPDPLTLRVREAGLLPVAGAPLPVRELMVVLAQPVVPEAEYTVAVTGILNLVGIGSGGGTSNFSAPAPPPAREALPEVEAAPPADEAAPPDEGAEEETDAP